jgi:hypothetical protein
LTLQKARGYLLEGTIEAHWRSPVGFFNKERHPIIDERWLFPAEYVSRGLATRQKEGIRESQTSHGEMRPFRFT